MIGCGLSVVGIWYLVDWYCLPDSSPILVFTPETSSRVTLASLGIGFQPNLPTSNNRQPITDKESNSASN